MGKLKLVVLFVTLLNASPTQIFGERYSEHTKSKQKSTSKNQKSDTNSFDLSSTESNLVYDYNSSRSNKSN